MGGDGDGEGILHLVVFVGGMIVAPGFVCWGSQAWRKDSSWTGFQKKKQKQKKKLMGRRRDACQ